MSDRELLELAAKAAEYSYTWSDRYECLEVWNDGDKVKRLWQTHRDDGDALRLAVKLMLRIDAGVDKTYVGGLLEPETHGNDPYAATRRAIVRAAAEIGKAMTKE